MPVFKNGDRVTLLINHPDGNRDYVKGETGRIIADADSEWVLVLWDTYSERATANDSQIMDIFPEKEWDTWFGHAWYVPFSVISRLGSFKEFRKKKKGEPIQLYRVCKKAWELDQRWKEEQIEKGNSVSL